VQWQCYCMATNFIEPYISNLNLLQQLTSFQRIGQWCLYWWLTMCSGAVTLLILEYDVQDKSCSKSNHCRHIYMFPEIGYLNYHHSVHSGMYTGSLKQHWFLWLPSVMNSWPRVLPTLLISQLRKSNVVPNLLSITGYQLLVRHWWMCCSVLSLLLN
jgi:hypothetical protein